MKQSIIALGTLGLLNSFVFAGPASPIQTGAAPEDNGFSNARRPISNPTLFDLALPTTNLHPLYLYHGLPNQVNTTLGDLPVGGDVQLYALQFEIALNERLSIVAVKDGYVDVSPDSTLSGQSGFANLGLGMKYAFYLDPVAQTAVSGTLTFEVPTGNSDVFQGEGDGVANAIVSGLKLVDCWQFAGGAGLQIPFSDEQSTSGWMSAHVSYELCSWFIPLVEVNWFHMIDAGNGTGNFPSQVGGALPAVIQSEGGDLFNLGSVNGADNRDFATVAIGFRSRLSDSVDVGAAYEIPLVDEKNGLMDERITVDLVWTF